MSMLKELFKKLIVMFIPSRCRLCATVTEVSSCLCDDCKTALRPNGKLCHKCGLTKEDCKCDEHNYKFEYAQFTAPFYFCNSIAKGIIRFKNYGYTELAKPYAAEIVNSINANFDSKNFDCVTYVPMRKIRRRKRGYNQSQLLANEVAEIMHLPVRDLLIKTRRTKSQRSSSARERRANLHGAFDLAQSENADGLRVLIIDDVKTTGSTLSECALTLKAYGAECIYAATVAVVDENKR
ncbi:MAG: ComF family protein [Ruminococcaceae bacterium]|nr:ComF family protein [Oscillospiraceae bacterium]